MKLFWNIFGSFFRTSLELLWNFFGTSLELLWNFFKASLDPLWNFFGTSLELLWNFLATSLQLLCNFFANSLQVLCKFFATSLQLLWNKYNDKDNPRDLWHLRHWLQFWELRTWIHGNLCYLTIKSDTGQHSQFLRCFHLFCHLSFLPARHHRHSLDTNQKLVLSSVLWLFFSFQIYCFTVPQSLCFTAKISLIGCHLFLFFVILFSYVLHSNLFG